MSRKDISAPEKHILYMKSGGFCAFPECGKKLVEKPTAKDKAAILGEVAHIVADSRQGPRGKEPLSTANRGKHPNLILLCRNHHKIIDSQLNTYSVAVLRQMKYDHETKVEDLLTKVPSPSSIQLISEKIQSTILQVTHLPQAVYAAPCAFNQLEKNEVKKRINYPFRDNDNAPYILAPFVLKDKKLYAFENLEQPNNLFSSVIDSNKVTRYRSTEMWEDPDGKRLYLNLLNSSLFKHTGRLGILFLPEHRRFHFPVFEKGVERSVSYRSANRTNEERQVAWEPKFRHNGEGKGFWFHLAARLIFHQMDDKQWCLSIRPERHLTLDGSEEFPADKIGRKVTKLKAKMFNDIYFNEIVFWRDYLSQGQPRFIFDYGSQKAVIDIQLITFNVDWIGIPGDEKPFKNEVYAEDLFTIADMNHSISGEELEWDEWEEEEIENETVQNEEIPF
jgi:hypothetical protein